MEKVDQLETLAGELLKGNAATHGLRRAMRRLVKEARLYKNHVEGAKKIPKLLDNPTGKLQIGGGVHILEGFLNIDIAPSADIVFDVREGIPLRDESCGFIFSEHFFEHIDYPVSAKKFMGECFRILKNSGVMVLGVPDSELMISAYSSRDKDFYKNAIVSWYSKRDFLGDIDAYIDLVNYHFRDQDDDEKYNPHFWAYDFEKLKSLAQNVGFRNVAQWVFDPKIANQKRKFGSIYIEAKK